MANKIKYGLKNVHYALLSIDTSTQVPTFDTPVKIPGGVSLELDPEGETNDFFADNIAYASFGANAGYSGSLEVALIPDSFREDVLGEAVVDDVHIEKAQASTQPFALLFQFEGDDSATRYVLYNCTATRTSISGKTTEESIEVQTETINIKVGAIHNAKMDEDIAKSRCDKKAAAYDDWFKGVWMPTALA
jgi:phi13 family phage major tail protein